MYKVITHGVAMVRHVPEELGGEEMQIGMIGIRRGGESFVIYATGRGMPERHLTDSEVKRISASVRDGDVDDDLVRWYLKHTQMCEVCRNKVASIPALMLREESIHTSEPPHPYDEVSNRPHKKFLY